MNLFSFPFLPFPFPYFFFPLPPIPFPFTSLFFPFPLSSTVLSFPSPNQLGGLAELCMLSQEGLGRNTGRERARARDTLSPITRLMAVNLFTDKAVVRKVTVWFQSGWRSAGSYFVLQCMILQYVEFYIKFNVTFNRNWAVSPSLILDKKAFCIKRRENVTAEITTMVFRLADQLSTERPTSSLRGTPRDPDDVFRDVICDAISRARLPRAGYNDVSATLYTSPSWKADNSVAVTTLRLSWWFHRIMEVLQWMTVGLAIITTWWAKTVFSKVTLNVSIKLTCLIFYHAFRFLVSSFFFTF